MARFGKKEAKADEAATAGTVGATDTARATGVTAATDAVQVDGEDKAAFVGAAGVTDAAGSADATGAASAKSKPAWGPRSTWAHTVTWQRLIIQIIFLVMAPQTFSLAFSGVKQLFAALGKLEAFDANSFLILLILLVVFTIVFGRFFCGYICAFGTIGDILYKVVDAPLSRLHVKRPRLPRRVEDVLRCLKYVVLLFFIVTSFVGLSSMVSVYSPWTAFGRLLALNIDDLNVIGLGLLVVIAIGMICKERFFCEFLCPLGALFSLLPVVPFSRITRHLPTCDECGACERSCPVAIMAPGDSARMGECISCDRCEPLCPHDCIGQCGAEALAARMEAAAAAQGLTTAEQGATSAAPQVIDQKASATESEEAPSQVASASESVATEIPHRVAVRNAGPDNVTKRAHTVRAVVLAVALFVVFWLLKAVNFLPTPW